ncbi:lipopolysaccharide assembly protein LapA domain-containing protein, partial [Sphingobium ummariense]
MQFLRTAFWVVIAVALAFFCMANYKNVEVRLWGDIVMETKLPVLLIGAFLLGALPFWVMARATRWRMKRRIESTERALAAATAAAA